MEIGLRQLLEQWLRRELPLAREEEKDGRTIFYIDKIDRIGAKSTRRKHIWIRIDDHAFAVETWLFKDGGEFTIEEDALVATGKWFVKAEDNPPVLKAADPEFFRKLTYYIWWASAVMTMGGTTPRPEGYRRGISCLRPGGLV